MNQLLNRLAEVKQSLTGKEVSQDELVYQKNANEVEHTTNTGFGKELVPVDVLSDSVYNAVPQYSSFLSMLPGFHGNNMGVSEKVAIKGEIGLAQGNSEWTTGAGIIAQGRNRLATGEVTINQAPMILSVDISKRLVNHSVADVEAFVRDEITRQFARTAESMIVNCDSSNLTTGNVNCDDATPTDTFTAGANDHRLLLDNGARKIAL
jgi:HK97 family phage major capsid protein